MQNIFKDYKSSTKVGILSLKLSIVGIKMEVVVVLLHLYTHCPQR